MVIQRRYAALMGVVSGAVFMAAAAMADDDELRAMAKARITLIEAIQIAEASENGKAFEAGIDDDSFRPEFEVSISREGRVYDIQVNAETGKILSVREDTDD